MIPLSFQRRIATINTKAQQLRESPEEELIISKLQTVSVIKTQEGFDKKCIELIKKYNNNRLKILDQLTQCNLNALFCRK